MLETILIVLNTFLLGALIAILLKFKQAIPDIQQILDDVGHSISEQMTQIFEKPQVSRAMSVLGKQSGEVRATKALRNKAADGLLAQYPSIKMVLDQLDISPIEGLQLMNDPIVGPMIKGALAKGIKGLTQGQKSSRRSGELGRI